MACVSGCEITDTQVADRPKAGIWLMSELVRSLVPWYLLGEQIASRWTCGGQVTGA